jgi:hypothetical protein
MRSKPVFLSLYPIPLISSSLNLSGSADPLPYQPSWYRGPPSLSTFLVLRTPPPSTFLVPFLVERTSSPLKRFWYFGPPPLSTFLLPRTPSPLNLNGTADPLPSQLFWYCGPPPVSTFLVLRTPSYINLSGITGLSTFLVLRTHPQNYPVNLWNRTETI